nr:MAG TPA: hypothetical protein [Caudoviricetes sp.]
MQAVALYVNFSLMLQIVKSSKRTMKALNLL